MFPGRECKKWTGRKMKHTKLIGDKNFYKKVMLIAIPVMIQNGITNFVSMLDNIMVGQIGTNEMSGVAIVNQLMFVFNICVFGAISGPGIFGAQYYGKGDYEGVKSIFRAKIWICSMISIIGLLVFVFYSKELIELYLHEGGEVGNLELTLMFARQYLFILLIGLIPFSISQIYSSTLRECGETVIPMIAGVVAVLINLGFNYFFIFGKFGAPKLGANGAAIATVISRFVECFIVVLWTHKNKEKNPFICGMYRTLKVPKEMAIQMIKKGSPLLANEALWAAGMAVIMQCYAYRGLTAVAAFNITSTINNVFNVVFIALGCSVSIILGQLLGAGKLEEARDSAMKLIAFSVVSCILAACVMAACSGVFPSIYKTEEEVKELASKLILVAAVSLPLQAFTNASYFTLRSGGKTFVTFLFDSVYVWVIMIPLALALSKYTLIPVVLVYLLVQGSELFKCIIGYKMVKNGVWIVNMVNGEEQG